MSFPVLWRGWECDSTAWIMEREDGTRYLRITNHGDPREAHPDFLVRKLLEYESAVRETKKALALLSENHSENHDEQ